MEEKRRPARIITVVLLILLVGLIGLGIGTWIGSQTGKNIGALLGIGKPGMNTIEAWQPPRSPHGDITFLLPGTNGFAAFRVDETFQTIQMGVDYYRDGELVKDEDQGTFDLRDEEGHFGQGTLGFLCQDAELTMGCSANGLGSYVDHITLPGYREGEEKGLSFAGMYGAQKIRAGEKIYIGMLTNGDSINTGAMEHPDRDTLKGKSWMVYAIFSDQPL